VTDRIRLFRAFPRTAALLALALALAVMLLVRLGPLCETMAMAAPSAATAMRDCASKPSDTSIKKAPSPPWPSSLSTENYRSVCSLHPDNSRMTGLSNWACFAT